MKITLTLLGLALPFAALALTSQDTPPTPEEDQPLAVGDRAPAFSLNDQNGDLVQLSEKSKKWTVIAFYPKALTPGWSLEFKSLQGAAQGFEELGVQVLGVSRDSVNDQKKFAKECGLDMSLLSDPDGSVTEKFDSAYDGRPFAKRVTFVVDPAGVVRMRDENVSVASHGDDLIEAIAALQGD